MDLPILLTTEQMIQVNSDLVAAYSMNCRESSSADEQTFFWPSPVFSGNNSGCADVTAIWSHTFRKRAVVQKRLITPARL